MNGGIVLINKYEKPLLVDSSIVVKWFVDEPDSKKAIKLRKQASLGQHDIAIAELAYYEIANALRHSKSLTEEDVHKAISSLTTKEIPILPFDITALHIAVENAYEYDISIYDAYFVAQADLEGMQLVTADERLASKVANRSDVVNL